MKLRCVIVKERIGKKKPKRGDDADITADCIVGLERAGGFPRKEVFGGCAPTR